MKTFTQLQESIALDILGIIKTYGGSGEVDIDDDYIATVIPSKEQLERIITALPEDVDYDVEIYEDGEELGPDSDPDEDDESEVDFEDLPDNADLHLIVYLYNTTSYEDLDEIRRVVKVNSKGKRRIKMQCKKGFKFNGKSCVKISGRELVTKRKAIRKAVRTKRSKGSGFQKRVTRLRNRANKKRKSMGVRSR